jgi:hypothetical protein
VAHNQINDVPHCGIVLNGGRNARGAHVVENLLFNTMKVLADGGGAGQSGSRLSGVSRLFVPESL